MTGGGCSTPDRGGVCAPGKGRRRAPPGLRYLLTQFRTPAPGRGPSRPRPCRLRPVPAPRSAEGTVLHTPQFSGSPGVPEPSRSRPGHGGCPGGSLRPWDSSAGAALGVPSGASPGLRRGRRRRAPPGLHTAAPLQSRPSGSPGGCWSPGQRDCSQRGGAAMNDRSLVFSRRGHAGRVHAGRGECLSRMEGAGSQRHRSWAHVTGLGRK